MISTSFKGYRYQKLVEEIFSEEKSVDDLLNVKHLYGAWQQQQFWVGVQRKAVKHTAAPTIVVTNPAGDSSIFRFDTHVHRRLLRYKRKSAQKMITGLHPTESTAAQQLEAERYDHRVQLCLARMALREQNKPKDPMFWNRPGSIYYHPTPRPFASLFKDNVEKIAFFG